MNKVKLSEVCDVRDGTHDSPKYVLEGYPLVTSKNIVDGYLDLSNVNYISNEDYEKINKRSKVDIGDIIMPMIGTIGNPYLVVDEPNYAIKNVALIKPNNKIILNIFILHYLMSNSFKSYIAKTNRGGTQKFLSLNDIRNIEIDLLSLPEQQQIADTLDKVSDLIAKRKQQLEQLDLLIKSRFVEMFGDPVTNEKRFKIVKLSEISDNFIGLTYKPSDVAENGTIVLRSSNIQNNELDLKDIVRVSTKIKDKFYVQKNDILMCSRNGSARLVGKVALIPELEENMTFGAFMTIVRSEFYNYLFIYFQLDAFKNNFQQAQQQ